MKTPSPSHSSQWAERRFEAILAAAQDAIIAIDAQGLITLFNPSAERMFGRAAADVVGRNVSLLMPPPYREEHDAYLARYQATGEPRAIGRIREVHGEHSNGEVFPLEVSVSEARIGDEVTYVAVLSDVSERVAAQETIRIREGMFLAFVDDAPTVAFLKDGEGRYLYVNRAYEKLVQRPRADILGRTDQDLLPAAVAQILRANDADVLAHRRPMELREEVPDAEGNPREWFAFKFPVEIGPARFGVGGVAINVTEQRRSERRFRMQFAVVRLMERGLESSDWMQALLCEVAEGLDFDAAEFWSVDDQAQAMEMKTSWRRDGADGARQPPRELRCSPNMGLPGRVWASGRPVLSRDVTADPTFLRREMASAASLRGCCAFPVRTENDVLGAILLYRSEPLHLDDDLPGLLETLGVLIGERLERERSRRRMQEAERTAAERGKLAEIGAVAARIVHDLGNPVAGIRLQAQLLERAARRAGREEFLEPAQQILETTSMLHRLVQGIKDFARNQRLDLHEFDVRDFLSALHGFWAPQAEERKVAFQVQLPKAPCPVRADGDKLRRVLDNLVKNALEAVPPGGRVVARCGRSPGGVRITIRDTGPGIPEGTDVFRLFESDKPAGSGLGLTIARELVAAHGGALSWEPIRPHGTAFHVDLPDNQAAPELEMEAAG